jgi:hypothetical protein
MAIKSNSENLRESGARAPKEGKSQRPDPVHTGDKGDEPKAPYGLAESEIDRGNTTRHYDGVRSPGTTGNR